MSHCTKVTTLVFVLFFFRCVFSPQLTSIQPRSRRASSQAAANTASSAVDDFDKLIMEFTDDENMLDDNVDNDVNEDDLLQELSEMIEIDGWETTSRVACSAVTWRRQKLQNLYFPKKNYNSFHYDIFHLISILVGRQENYVLEKSDVYTVYAKTAQVGKKILPHVDILFRRLAVDWTGALYPAHANWTARFWVQVVPCIPRVRRKRPEWTFSSIMNMRDHLLFWQNSALDSPSALLILLHAF